MAKMNSTFTPLWQPDQTGFMLGSEILVRPTRVTTPIDLDPTQPDQSGFFVSDMMLDHE